MSVVFEVFNWFLENIWKQTALFMGFIALLGLLVQKKKPQEVIEGVLLTIVGYYAFNAGSGLILGAIGKVNNILMPSISTDFGVYPYTTTCVNTCYSIAYLAGIIMQVFIISWFLHIIVVKLFSKWFKVVYLTVHMMLNVTAVNLLFWYCCIGLKGAPLWIVVIVINCLYFTLSPMLVYKQTQEMTGGAFALGHTQQIGAWFGGLIAGAIGDPKDDADKIKLPGWLGMFSQTTLNLAVSMPLTFIICLAVALIIGNADAMAVMEETLAGQNWILWCFAQGCTFAAGIAVLMYGLRTFLGSLVPAFKGFSDKIMPGCVPALDCVAFFGYSPVGVTIGFLGYCIGGLIVCIGCILFKTPVFVFPSISTSFFDGGCVGVFANKKGGWKGCLIASIICGFLMHFGSGLLATGLLGELNAQSGFSPGNFDLSAVAGPLFWGIKMLLGK